MYWTRGGVGCFLIWWSYYTIARIFKWMTLIHALFLAAFFAKPDWGQFSARSCPCRMVRLVAGEIFPDHHLSLLFFWQASQE
jgi:hypothetical protein